MVESVQEESPTTDDTTLTAATFEVDLTTITTAVVLVASTEVTFSDHDVEVPSSQPVEVAIEAQILLVR
ncbi:MAG TPA: hypothetical protein VF228_03275 [Iamia sp.]